MVITKYTDFLLLEAKDLKRNIAEKLGYNEKWCEYFHSISNKYSFDIAKAFLKFILNPENLKSAKLDLPENYNNLTTKEKVEMVINKNAEQIYDNFLNDFTNISDYLNWYNGLAEQMKKEMNLNIRAFSFEELKTKADEYHNMQASKAEESEKKRLEEIKKTRTLNRKDETPETDKFITYPNGWYWINLKSSSSSDEADNMGHCGSDAGKTLFSLRDDLKQSKITASVDLKNQSLYQCKGKANSKPKKEYHQYIIDLLMNTKYPINYVRTGGYRSDLDFSIMDLPEAQREKILKAKPNLFNVKYWFEAIKNYNSKKTDENLKTVNSFIANGIDLNMKSDFGNHNALYMAIEAKNNELFKLLIEKGAKFDKDCLEYALKIKNQYVLEYIIDNGKDIALDKNNKDIRDLLNTIYEISYDKILGYLQKTKNKAIVNGVVLHSKYTDEQKVNILKTTYHDISDLNRELKSVNTIDMQTEFYITRQFFQNKTSKIIDGITYSILMDGNMIKNIMDVDKNNENEIFLTLKAMSMGGTVKNPMVYKVVIPEHLFNVADVLKHTDPNILDYINKNKELIEI